MLSNINHEYLHYRAGGPTICYETYYNVHKFEYWNVDEYGNLKIKKKSEGRVNILKNHSFYKEHFSIQNK